MTVIQRSDKMKTYIGIDPGKTGAYAIMTVHKDVFKVDVYDFTTFKEAAEHISTARDGSKNTVAILEKVHAFPGQGVTSMFNFGANYGGWQALLDILDISHMLKAPQSWQKGLLSKADGINTKEQSLVSARRLFPDMQPYLKRKKDNGRADAMLIAWHAFQVWAK